MGDTEAIAQMSRGWGLWRTGALQESSPSNIWYQDVPSPFLFVVPWFFNAIGSSLTGQEKNIWQLICFSSFVPPFFLKIKHQKQLETYKIPELMIEKKSSNPFKTKHCSCIAKPELLFFFWGVYNRFSHQSVDEKPSEVVSIAGSRAHQPCGWFTTNDPAENWDTGWIRSWRDEIHIW